VKNEQSGATAVAPATTASLVAREEPASSRRHEGGRRVLDSMFRNMESVVAIIFASDRPCRPTCRAARALITGPSRTGDIEQRIELGAHGPRRLHIILIDDGASA